MLFQEAEGVSSLAQLNLKCKRNKLKDRLHYLAGRTKTKTIETKHTWSILNYIKLGKKPLHSLFVVLPIC